MDSLKHLTQKKILPKKKDPHLHSAAHLLADELSEKLGDKKHFGLYLKMAILHSPDVLRKILGQVLESPKAYHKGKLFSYLVKKHNQEIKQEKNDTPAI